MNLGNQISFYRKQASMTQEQLAAQLGVSNQAVSKWELEQCYPDITLLPKIADLFSISLDDLFGYKKANEMKCQVEGLPWEEDNTLHAVLYLGHNLVKHEKVNAYCKGININFEYEGPAVNIYSDFSVTCGAVQGDVTAGGRVTCEDIGGNVDAGDSLTCRNISGNAYAGDSIQCNDIYGNASAGDSINCNNIEGSASAGDDINCSSIK